MRIREYEQNRGLSIANCFKTEDYPLLIAFMKTEDYPLLIISMDLVIRKMLEIVCEQSHIP